MSKSTSKKCPTKKGKNISIRFESLSVESEKYIHPPLSERICDVTVEVSVRIRLSDIDGILRKKLNQKDLQYIIKNRIK